MFEEAERQFFGSVNTFLSGDFGYALGKFTKFPVSDPEIYILVNITELETNNNINSKKCAIKIPLPQQVTVTSDDK